MSHLEESVLQRARALRSAARLLREQSQCVRDASHAVQDRARLALGRAARHATDRGDPSRVAGAGADAPRNRRTMARRHHERWIRPGRRCTDRRPAAVDHRRVLLVSADDTWRLVTAYMFEEAGYVVDTATGHGTAIAISARRLPDVIVVQLEPTAMQALLHGLVPGSGAADIPVVVLTASLISPEAQHARTAGAITLVAVWDTIDALVGEVDTWVAAAPRAQRALLRRLRDLQALARRYPPDPEGQAAFHRLIEPLQVALFAMNEDGHCIAASAGATALTGYSREQLLRASVFHARFARGWVSAARWQTFLQQRHFSGTTMLTTHAGEDLPVHAVALALILPGVHVAAVIRA